MKNAIITIIIVLSIIGTVFAALVKLNVIEFGHHEKDGHEHSAKNAGACNSDHDHSTHSNTQKHNKSDGHNHDPKATTSCDNEHDHSSHQ
jgi:hypothetical protein